MFQNDDLAAMNLADRAFRSTSFPLTQTVEMRRVFERNDRTTRQYSRQ